MQTPLLTRTLGPKALTFQTVKEHAAPGLEGTANDKFPKAVTGASLLNHGHIKPPGDVTGHSVTVITDLVTIFPD